MVNMLYRVLYIMDLNPDPVKLKKNMKLVFAIFR
jgi:hypothetical protein